MGLIITGCEYSGTTTLANAVCEWAEGAMGGRIEPHDHFKIPNIACYQGGREGEPLTPEERGQILGLSPKLKEMLQRQGMVYHYPIPTDGPDNVLVGFHVEDAVYGPMYFGYGLEDEPQGGPRSSYARRIESTLLERAPEIVLVLLKASRDVIAERMKESPHEDAIVKEQDIQEVLDKFDSEYEASLLHNKMVLNTSDATVDQTLEEFKTSFETFITQDDRRRIVVQRGRSNP